MHPLFWKQTLNAKRQAVISALLTTPVSLFARNSASVVQYFKKSDFCLLLSNNSKVFNSYNRRSKYYLCAALPVSFTNPDNLLLKFSTMSPKPPKGKKAAKPPKADKESKVEKKAKPTKKGAGDAPSRQSKRNVDKVAVSYKEVAENVDEKASESNRPKAKAAVKAKKSKYTVDSGSDVSEESSEEADSEDEKRKKKKRLAPTPRSAAERKETTPVAKKAKSEDAEPMNKTETDFSAIDFKSDKTTSDGKPWNLKISSWNIGGVKAWLKKGAIDYIKHEDPDIFCVQEVRCAESKMPPGTTVDGYHVYWSAAEKDGYSGVGLYSKVEPLSVAYGLGEPEHDTEGRLITAEYEAYYVVAAYVPNAGRGLVTLPKRLKWDPAFRAYLKGLDDKKPVILCGDLNVAHQAIDLANPKSNARSAGFTQEERDGFSELLKEGFVDSYRHLRPDAAAAYTYWTYMGNARSRNVGWRLDYFVLSEKLLPNLCDNVIRSEVLGSDHCPIALLLNV